MNKKAIAILGAIFLLIVGTLGFLIFSKYGGSKSSATPANQISSNNNSGTGSSTVNNVITPPPATTTPSSTPPSTTGFSELISDHVVSPVLFYSGKGITYFDNQGNLYQASFQPGSNPLQIGSKQSLGIEARQNITKILWPAQGDNFIVEMSSASGTSWSFYNSAARIYTDLPPQVEALDWLPNGNQVYYIWLENNKATLNVSDSDTKNWKYIADMWETDDAISVSPDGKNILYYEQNSTNGTNPINLVTPDGKIWKTLVSTGYNTGVLWSPDSQKFLFAKKDSATSQYQLWYYNLLTGEVSNLHLNTVPSKVVWGKDSQTIYAAVPTAGVSGGNSLTTDAFYKLDASTLDKQAYNPGSLAIDGRDLFLSLDESQLFFKNAQDGGLYYLNLNQ